MAKLSDFRVDTRAINDGAWTKVDPGRYGDLEILSRGFTDEFTDAQNARVARASEKYGGDRTRIPNAEMREINASLLRDFLVLDVRGITDDQDNPLSVEEFHRFLSDPAYGLLARAAFEAAGRVSSRSSQQLQAAMGNSSGASAGS